MNCQPATAEIIVAIPIGFTTDTSATERFRMVISSQWSLLSPWIPFGTIAPHSLQTS